MTALVCGHARSLATGLGLGPAGVPVSASQLGVGEPSQAVRAQGKDSLLGLVALSPMLSSAPRHHLFSAALSGPGKPLCLLLGGRRAPCQLLPGRGSLRGCWHPQLLPVTTQQDTLFCLKN